MGEGQSNRQDLDANEWAKWKIWNTEKLQKNEYKEEGLFLGRKASSAMKN